MNIAAILPIVRRQIFKAFARYGSTRSLAKQMGMRRADVRDLILFEIARQIFDDVCAKERAARLPLPERNSIHVPRM